MQTREPYLLTQSSYSFVYQLNDQKKWVKKILGEGCFAITYFGSFQNQAVAIKQSKVDQTTDPTTTRCILKSFENELDICKKIEKARKDNPNDQDAYNCLVKLLAFDIFYKTSVQIILLLYEFLDLGDLDHWKDNDQFTWPMRYKVLKDVARGLACLHKLKPPIIHGDVKPANILLYQDGPNKRAKLIDFGLSKEQDSDIDDPGSKLFTDPQNLLGNEARTTSLDIWSFGLVLYVLFEKKNPYEDSPIKTDNKKLIHCIVTQRKKNLITIPNAHTLESMKVETMIIKKMLEVEYDGDDEDSDEELALAYDSVNVSDLLDDDEMQIDYDLLKEAKREVKKAPLQAEKASIIVSWCCQFSRKRRPTADELVVELSTAPHVISDNLATMAKNNFRR